MNWKDWDRLTEILNIIKADSVLTIEQEALVLLIKDYIERCREMAAE